MKELFIIGTCLLVWCVLLSGWSYTLDTSIPTIDDDPAEAPDRMRETKAALVERLDIDHYFEPSATSIYDAADCGKHRWVCYREPNSIVSVAPDEAYTYTKDVCDVAEFHWIDENEAEVQITSGGQLYVVTASIADANVTLAKMADDSIDSNSYVDGSIDTIHIADANITSAKIADDSILPADVNSIFGSWTTLDSGSNTLIKDEVYKVGSDGFVSAYTTSVQNYVYGYTDGSSSPTTQRAAAIHAGGSFGSKPNGFTGMPVKKDDYFKVTSDETTVTIYWLPIGSGTCVKQ